MFNPHNPDPSDPVAFKRDGFPKDPNDPRRAWTIEVTIWLRDTDGTERRTFAARNTVTGKRGPERNTYDAAMEDIPAGEWHNYVQ